MSKPVNRVTHWLPVTFLFLFLAACSEAPTANQPLPETAPTVSETQVTPEVPVTPSPAPEAAEKPVAPAKSPPQATPRVDRSTSKPISKRSEVVATASGQRIANLRPTYQTTPRMAGFSPDGNYFIYLESSRDTGAGIPKSQLQVIDVSANACIENGCLETSYREPEASLSLSEAEDELLKQSWKVRQTLKLTPPAKGESLPILSRSRNSEGTETILVRLAGEQEPLRLQLRQRQTGSEVERQTAMQLDVFYQGQRRSLDSLSNFRERVLDYSIREVRLSPDGKSIAVLITTTKPTFEGTLGTTLVQSFAL